MRRMLVAALGLCLLLGVIWMGQGVGLIPGSFMSGRIEWAVIGAVLSGVAAAALWLVLRPRAG